jgi:peptidoglycan-associated lipoprotein
MKHTPRWTTHALAALAVLALVSAGCAKKATEQPPTTTQAPPQQAPPSQQPTTPPTETPTPAPTKSPFSAADLQPIFFDTDQSTLRDDARSTLDQDARMLRENSGAKIVIEGHADERGTVEYNQALGERRAQAARDYLVQAGIDASRLQIISYGKERPFDPGHDEAAWAKNRRAHFTLQ